jgi:hypothetical protein
MKFQRTAYISFLPTGLCASVPEQSGRPAGHVRQRDGNIDIAEVALDHAATVEIWVVGPICDGVSSAIVSVQAAVL